ncbi:MAG: DUF1492 domain-containing protein [Clostridia bacterium]|nr:DUF1492 domain-containing protein [Clostridia bacterium]
MTRKEYLNQAYWLDRRIDSKLEQLSALKEMATKTTSIMNDDVVSHSRNLHSLQDVISKIIDMQAEINNDIDHLVNLKQEIMQVIKEVQNPEHQILLEQRYLCFKSWESVAEELGYNVRHVYRLHDEAVEQITIPETCQ